jgi:hypothetical protein
MVDLPLCRSKSGSSAGFEVLKLTESWCHAGTCVGGSMFTNSTVTPSASSGQALSRAKGLGVTDERFFAEFILECSEGLRMTRCLLR